MSLVAGVALAACCLFGGDPLPKAPADQPQDQPRKVVVTLEERRFDVAGLIAPRDFPAVDLRRRRASLEGPARNSHADGAKSFTIADALRQSAGVTWGVGCEIALERDGAVLRVVHTHRAQERIAEWLAALRDRMSRRIAVEATVLAADAPRHRKPPMRIRGATEAEARRLIDSAATADHLQRLNEFRLELIDGQLGNLLAANQVSYLGMPEVTATPYAKAFDPQVHVVLEGLAVETRATWSPTIDTTIQDPTVWLDFRLQAATLIRPIKQMQSPIGTIQFPIVVHQQARGEIRLPERGWAILSGLREVDEAGKPQRHLLFVLQVTVTHLTPPDPEFRK